MTRGIEALLAKILSQGAQGGIVVIGLPLSGGGGDTDSLPEGIRDAVTALAEAHPANGAEGGFFLNITRFSVAKPSSSGSAPS